ncbi:MAG: molybdenum cofactor biosynthesis protein MoaE [Phycisphaerales bacterium]|nr:molybdenum cofactor biosynthesis protein MoaE [Phycisphaerales bacterium]
MIAVAEIVDGPIDAEALSQVLASQRWRGGSATSAGRIGATVRFDGIVRRMEPGADGDDRPLRALDYETYDPMAQRELLTLAQRTLETHALQRIAAIHSRGRVRVGETSFVLIIEAPHRAQALSAMSSFIDELKRDVPIWKRPIWEC